VTLIDARPGRVDVLFKPGDPLPVVLNWPAGALSGRTFTSTLGAASLGVVVVGDVMTITATPAQTAAVVAAATWELVDTTAADDVTVLSGRWVASELAAGHAPASVTVAADVGTVEVTVPGATAVGDLTVAGDLVVAGALTVTHPLVFWQHPVSQTIPNALWTPVAWNSLVNTVGPGWTSYVPATCVVAAGSNGVPLPGGGAPITLNVDAVPATAPAAGYLAVRISGTDRVVQYTGKTATSFTGVTGGVGTLATGQSVAIANVEFNIPVDQVGPLIAETAWSSNGTGGRWTRLRALNALGPGFHINGGTGYAAAIASADPLIRSVCCEQPAFKDPGIPYRVEVQHTAGPGVNLDLPVDQLAAPRLVVQALSAT
jgi:hypothetical protein